MADLEYIELNGERLAIKDSRLDNLSTVGTSGSYNDLTDKPKIPTITYDDVNQLKIVTQ